MQELNLMSFEGAPVRSLLIEGEPWWVAADVCGVLELSEPHRSLAILDEDEKGRHSMTTPGGHQDMTVINEAGLYSLILRSRKPQAKRFKRWITHEVLPSIRKTGGYGVIARDPLTEVDRTAQMLGQLMQLNAAQFAALQGETTEAKAIAVEASTKAEQTAADLAEYQAEHDKSRIQPYMRSVADIKDQVIRQLAARDPGANVRVLYQRFTRDMRDLANVATTATSDQTVSTAKRLLSAAQTLAKRHGVAITVQMPIAQEA